MAQGDGDGGNYPVPQMIAPAQAFGTPQSMQQVQGANYYGQNPYNQANTMQQPAAANLAYNPYQGYANALQLAYNQEQQKLASPYANPLMGAITGALQRGLMAGLLTRNPMLGLYGAMQGGNSGAASAQQYRQQALENLNTAIGTANTSLNAQIPAWQQLWGMANKNPQQHNLQQQLYGSQQTGIGQTVNGVNNNGGLPTGNPQDSSSMPPILPPPSPNQLPPKVAGSAAPLTGQTGLIAPTTLQGNVSGAGTPQQPQGQQFAVPAAIQPPQMQNFQYPVSPEEGAAYLNQFAQSGNKGLEEGNKLGQFIVNYPGNQLAQQAKTYLANKRGDFQGAMTNATNQQTKQEAAEAPARLQLLQQQVATGQIDVATYKQRVQAEINQMNHSNQGTPDRTTLGFMKAHPEIFSNADIKSKVMNGSTLAGLRTQSQSLHQQNQTDQSSLNALIKSNKGVIPALTTPEGQKYNRLYQRIQDRQNQIRQLQNQALQGTSDENDDDQ